MNLSDLLTERLIAPDLKADGKLALLDELAHLIARNHEGVNPEAVTRALLDRERIMSTAVGHGVAIPHAKTSAVDQIVGCLGLHRAGVDFDAEDGSKTHVFFTLLAPVKSSEGHLEVLAQIARLCHHQGFLTRLQDCQTSAEMYQLIRDVESEVGAA